MSRVVIIDDEVFDGHMPLSDLPEKSRRTQGIRAALREAPFANRLTWIAPAIITHSDLCEVHACRYVDEVFNKCAKLEAAAAACGGKLDPAAQAWISNDPEVPVSAGSLAAILHAAGAAQQAVRMVMSDGDPTTRVFCNVRPPGHHAHATKGQGFCVFNNIWIAACEARKMGAQRVAIIDWDVHHGNGTQDFILGHPEEADTLFFSIHQDHRSIWPGTGKESTRGHHGTVRCGEMAPGARDDDVKRYFAEVVLPKLREFRPDIVLISCGFDAHIKDQIARLRYSSQVYGWMTERLVEVANEFSNGRIVSILEGGYCVPALQESALVHVEALL